MRILIDHNMEGQAALLWRTLAVGGWQELLSLEFLSLADVDLPFDTSDRTLWRFAQEHGLILLTANRTMKGDDSLEQTIQEENLEVSLPVITIANLDRLYEPGYRERCSARLLEILIYLETYLGMGRVFIP